MRITQHKTNGVLLEFNNGLKLSTRWGYCNYCENYDKESEDLHGFGVQKDGSHDVEFMFTGGDEKLIKKLCKKFGSDDNPSGYVKLEKWLAMLAYINKKTKK